MTALREAAQQALEVLKDYKRSDDDRVSIAMHILCTALAEPTVKESLPVESAFAENATTQQQLEEAPPSDYRRGYWDGFEIGKREGRIEAENALAEPVQGPVAWTPVTEALPQSGVKVLACYRNSLGNLRRIRAMWTAAKTEEADSEDAETCSEYDEATDTYYVTEGWYECIDNWGDYSSVAVTEGEVTHWMPLPPDPDSAPPQRPAEPQEPVAWLRVIDEAMVTHHLGVADPADDYETAKRKMNNLLCIAQDIGTYFAKQAEPVQELVAFITPLMEQQMFDDWCPYKGSPDLRTVWAAAVDSVNGLLLGAPPPPRPAEPVAYAVGRTLHWHEGKGVSDAQLYLDPPQRPAEPVQEPQGCDHCKHPLYAGIKCRMCGRVTEPTTEESSAVEPVQEPDVPATNFGNMEPVGWLESPRGAFRANPLYKIQFPSQLLSWQVPVFTALAQPVQEPVAYSEGRTLHWHDGKGVNDAQLYLAPQQRNPVGWDGRCMLGHCNSPAGCENSGECRAVERAHGIKE